MNYRELEIWKMARDLTVNIHCMTLEKLPKFEMYEEGSQIRRSMKSVRSNIVEGFGRRRYKQEFIRFLTYTHSSCDETIDHLETLFEAGSLTDRALFTNLRSGLNTLGAKPNRFIQSVDSSHQSIKEDPGEYNTKAIEENPYPDFRIPHHRGRTSYRVDRERISLLLDDKMTTIKLSEAKAHLGKYAKKASKGDCFIIADRNKAVAQLGPLPKAEISIRPTLGLFDGQARIPDDFDASMKEFESDFYGA